MSQPIPVPEIEEEFQFTTLFALLSSYTVWLLFFLIKTHKLFIFFHIYNISIDQVFDVMIFKIILK